MSTEAVNPRHASEADAKADRELCGRFAAGNPGGPGNPYARQTAMFKKAIHAATTPDEATALARKIYEMAMEGDLAAARLYFSYTAGKPQEAIDPDRVDIHELQIYRETAPLKMESAALIAAGSAETHLHTVRTMQPMIGALMHQHMMDTMNESPEDREKREAAEAAEAERILSTPVPEMEGIGAPSPNGSNGDSVPERFANTPPPSSNGSNGDSVPERLVNTAPPSPNGSNGDSVLERLVNTPPPSPNVSNGDSVLERFLNSRPPLPNGVPQELPSVIDGYGKPAPSPNGKNGQSKRKKKKNRAPKPSPNGRWQFSG